MFKKLLLTFTCLFLTFSFLLAPTASAQTGTWYSPNYDEFYDKVFNTDVSPETEIFGERYTTAQVYWVIWSIRAFIINLSGVGDTVNCITRSETDLSECAQSLQTASTNTNAPNSLVASNQNTMIGGLMAGGRISGVGYIMDIGKKFNLVPEAQAQGFGYLTGGSAIQKLWRLTRDIAYTFMIIIIIVMAFMIMFRVKLSPQTVITVQSALPRVVSALILITFSYAIAGFLIDMMYVIFGIVVAVIDQSDLWRCQPAANSCWGQIFTTLAIPSGWTGMLVAFQYLVGFAIAFAMAVSQLGSGGWLAVTFGAILGVVVLVVGIIAVLLAVFKIVWMLLKTYVNILLQIMIGPLQILIGSISNFGGFGSWMRNLIGELSVFPVAALLYVLSFVFLAGSISASAEAMNDTVFGPWVIENVLNIITVDPEAYFTGTNIWTPPMTIGTDATGLLWLVVSWVIFSMIPKTAEVVKGFMSGKPFAYGTAVGEALGPATGMARSGGYYGAERGIQAFENIAAAKGRTSGFSSVARKLTGLRK